MADKPELKIVKPSGFSLDKFKTKGGAAAASVDTLQAALMHCKIKEAKDFVRLHKNEDEFWTPELCFVNVPTKGQKRDTLHLIDEELAVSYLVDGRASDWLWRRSRSMRSSCVTFLRRTWTMNGTPAPSLPVSRPSRCGCKSQVAKPMASTVTRPGWRATPVPSPNRNGRRNH